MGKDYIRYAGKDRSNCAWKNLHHHACKEYYWWYLGHCQVLTPMEPFWLYSTYLKEQDATYARGNISSVLLFIRPNIIVFCCTHYKFHTIFAKSRKSF